MAGDYKKKNETKTDYKSLLRELKDKGPERLYTLWGEEDYLLGNFFNDIKNACLGDGGEDFNHHRLEGEKLDIQKLSQAVDTVPFFGERTLIEVRNFDVNACLEDMTERLKPVISDIPDYATLVFLLPTGCKPDGRRAGIKLLKSLGRGIEFTTQPQDALVNWIGRRFAAHNKKISIEDCKKLIFISGDHMQTLIPEIEKIAGYVKSDVVCGEDIQRLAQRIPEASVFDMTDCIAAKNYDGALGILAELLQTNEPPVKILAMIGYQMRKLYSARVAIDAGLKADYLVKSCGFNAVFQAERFMRSARGFSKKCLAKDVELCTIADYRMKSSSEEDENILSELLLRMALGEAQ
ncbi:MAG: DNA polymerase III subunit delta [Oscillospiraceae bacterium]